MLQISDTNLKLVLLQMAVFSRKRQNSVLISLRTFFNNWRDSCITFSLLKAQIAMSKHFGRSTALQRFFRNDYPTNRLNNFHFQISEMVRGLLLRCAQVGGGRARLPREAQGGGRPGALLVPP